MGTISRRKAAGLCIVCEASAVNKNHCESCRIEANLINQRSKNRRGIEPYQLRQAARVADGRCGRCGDKLFTANLCILCRDKENKRRRAYDKIRRANCISMGICTRCGESTIGCLLCEDCKAKNYKYKKPKKPKNRRPLRVDLRKSMGLCIRCGLRPLVNKNHCITCRDRIYALQRVSYHNSKPQI